MIWGKLYWDLQGNVCWDLAVVVGSEISPTKFPENLEPHLQLSTIWVWPLFTELGPKNPIFAFKSFLTNRQQRVVIQGITSSWADIISGVPQGSDQYYLSFLLTTF